MFGTVLLLVATLMHVYVFGRAASVPVVRRRVPRRLLFGAGAIAWALFFAARFAAHGRSGAIPAALELAGMNWMGALFLTSACLLALDIVTAFGLVLPRLAPSLRGAAVVAGIVLSAIALFQGMRPPVVEEYRVRLPGLPRELDGTTLVAMSDLHLGSQLGERWLADRVAQVQAVRPDLIVLLGDIFEGHAAPEDGLVATLGTLSAPWGVYAVPGNHEAHGWGGNGRLPIDQAGIRVLRDRWVEVRPGLVLAGIDDLAARRSGAGGGEAAAALAGRPGGAAILLAHAPRHPERAAAAGAGLMLSGHTHGGQIWPLGYLVRRIHPLLDGVYDVDGMKLVVTRGAGTWGPRMRLWRPAQILCVTLESPGR
ncbi:MAG: metallophosphoesterase [Gemmatimonadota bacterium]